MGWWQDWSLQSLRLAEVAPGKHSKAGSIPVPSLLFLGPLDGSSPSPNGALGTCWLLPSSCRIRQSWGTSAPAALAPGELSATMAPGQRPTWRANSFAIMQDNRRNFHRHPEGAEHLTQPLSTGEILHTTPYSPRILRGRKRFEAPSRTVPSDRPSFREICRKSDECPQTRARGRCKNGWRVQCARRGVYCTAREKQENQCCGRRTEGCYSRGLCFDGLNDLHIAPGTGIFCSMVSMMNFTDCVTDPCEQGSTSKKPVSPLQTPKHGPLQGGNLHCKTQRE